MNKKAWKRVTGNLLLHFVGKSSTVDEIRKTFYRVVIINMFWLDGNLPKAPDQKIEFLMNPRWGELAGPKDYMGLRHLSQEMLIYLCGRLKRPEWVDGSNAIKVKMSSI
ncbi:MAG: hypothetical protein QM730_27005 [Anaerolineales bacterium]